MKRLLAGTVLVGAVLSAGCDNRNQIEQLAVQLDETRQRVEALDAANLKLQAEITRMQVVRAQDATNAPGVDVESSSRIVKVLASNINAIVTAQIDERIGTVADIDAIMAESIQDELAAADERKKEEQRVRRDEWRKGWEQSRTESLVKELGLDEDQKTQVAASNEEMRNQFRETMQEIRSGGDWTQVGGAMADIRQSNNERMREIMTEDQYSSYTNRQSNQVRGMMDIFSGAMGGRRRGGGQ